MDEAFVPKFTIEKDMKPIYMGLHKRFPDGFPEVLVVEELENGENIVRIKFNDGRSVYYVKNDTDEAILERLIREIENPVCDNEPAFPTFYHTLNNRNVAKMCVFACYIADMLNIPLKQIIFIESTENTLEYENFPYIIGDNLENFRVVFPHEIRHSWQRKNRPDMFENYISVTDVDENNEEAWIKYNNQPAEIDAQAFALKLESMLFGTDYRDINAYNTRHPEYRDKLISRANEIDIILSKKKLNELRKLLYVNEYMQITRAWAG